MSVTMAGKREGSASSAASMTPAQRQDLALQALTGEEAIVELARRHDVSRKFIYQQSRRADAALTDAFAPQEAGDERILFHLPVTHQWLCQLVVALVLTGHAPMRGVVELLKDLFDYDISLGTVHNVIAKAVETARKLQENEDLSHVRVGAHDEIYQVGEPVLVGADVHSTYCYLLEKADGLDAETWALHLMDLQPKGLAPLHTIADGGQSLRCGQHLAWPDVPCHADVFHAMMSFGDVVSILENRAYAAIQKIGPLQKKQRRLRHKPKSISARHSVGRHLQIASEAQRAAIQSADDVALLYRWMRDDVLALVGPDLQTRCQLFDFIITELRQRRLGDPNLIDSLSITLENQRDKLLAFVQTIDQHILVAAQQFQLPVFLVRETLQAIHRSDASRSKWQAIAHLRKKLGHLFHPLCETLREMLSLVVRASSIVENLNSRLRSYFFLRRHIGPAYLQLLRYFLNHRRFQRSEVPARQGKSPAELLTGQSHPHWLEMLGFKRFSRQAA